MSVKIYQFNLDKGHAYSIGSGFGADSFSGEGYHNIPEGYVYLNNFIYREDKVLRPMFSSTSLTGAGTGAVVGIFAGETDTLYMISTDGNLYYSTNNGTSWTTLAGTFPTDVQYSWATYANNKVVFTPKSSTTPTYIITE